MKNKEFAVSFLKQFFVDGETATQVRPDNVYQMKVIDFWNCLSFVIPPTITVKPFERQNKPQTDPRTPSASTALRRCSVNEILVFLLAC
jgi:hypothetical protein